MSSLSQPTHLSERASENSGDRNFLSFLEWSPYQWKVLALVASAVTLDGLDNLLLGTVIPALMVQWQLVRADFVVIVALSIALMSVGTAAAGLMGDRFGRRPTLTASVLLFGIATAASALAPDLKTFGAWRLLSAIGLGGVFPNAVALAAEFAPVRHRNAAISSVILCVPVGGLLGGILASNLLPTYGWRVLCGTGGVAALCAGLLLLVALPESPSFLFQRGRIIRLQALLMRCRSPSQIGAADGVAAAPRPRPGRSSLSELMSSRYRADTLRLWAMLFFNSLAVYGVFNWAPTLIHEAGFTVSAAAFALAVFNIGGIAGALLGGPFMDRFGSRLPTISFAVAATTGATILGLTGWPDANSSALNGGFVLLGVFCCGLQPMLFSLSSQIYPASMRATGAGTAIGIGRLGAICSALLGVGTLSIDLQAFLFVFGAALLITTLSLVPLSRHTQPKTTDH